MNYLCACLLTAHGTDMYIRTMQIHTHAHTHTHTHTHTHIPEVIITWQGIAIWTHYSYNGLCEVIILSL